jgi:hypothetical protein
MTGKRKPKNNIGAGGKMSSEIAKWRGEIINFSL